MSGADGDTLAAHRRASEVYCRGPLLDAVQRARLFDDAKHFVDMPLRADPEDVLAAFDELPADAKTDPERLRAFVDEHFAEPGAELEPFVPEGCPEEPPFAKEGGLKNEALREFAIAIHKLWPTLCRVTAPGVAAAPQRNSALPRRHPMVLPGGRFRETYYWDSLWIVHGLLASGLLQVAQGLVQNLLDDVDQFGFVPNGGRVYYLNRSQPPLLSAMVAAVSEKLDDAGRARWLPGAVGSLKKEHAWWMSDEHGHAVRVGDVTMNRFNANWDEPRPESYWQDYETSRGDPRVCRQLASVAETGWDFSSRWSREGGRAGGGKFNLSESEATFVLPVDLNAIMYRFERTLAELCEVAATGCSPDSVISKAPWDFSDAAAVRFAEAAQSRYEAFHNIFWKEPLGRWVDVWLPRSYDGRSCLSPDDLLEGGDAAGRAPTLADFAAPLWANLASNHQAIACQEALWRSGLVGPGGVATTANDSGEQWDAPNAWPPLQAMLIEGLPKSSDEGIELALELAQRWVGTCYAAWRSTGYMHEKYSATEYGKGGAGGEYESQVGFGWSNGVVLQLLAEYGDRLATSEMA